MWKPGPAGKKWLRGAHLFLAAIWLGTAVAMNLVMMVNGRTTSGDELYATNAAVKLLDDFLIIPSALGCLCTGLFLSLFTAWGFFRFRWVTVKWVLTVGFVVFGTFWLGPWLNAMTGIADRERAGAWQNPEYLYDRRMLLAFGFAQMLLLAVTIFISVLRPWGRRAGPTARAQSESSGD